jgi:hypothetical protein
MRSAAIGALGLTLLTGCATHPPAKVLYNKPGATASDVLRDQALCAGRSSAADTRTKLLATVATDRDEYVRCMEALGYTTDRVSLRR